MKLTVENFGPIREARNIVVNPMTIFVGPSNTGKSYLATLIYAILRVIGGQKAGTVYGMPFTGIARDKYHEMVNTICREGKNLEDPNELNQVIRKKMRWIIDEIFIFWTQNVVQEIKDQILRCFGEEGRNIMENGEDLRVEMTGQGNNLFLDVAVPEKSKLGGREKNNIIEQIRGDIPDRLKRIEREMDWEGPHSPPERLLFSLLVEIYVLVLRDAFVSPLLGRSLFFRSPGHPRARRDGMEQTHYLPAIRGGIMQSHRTLVSALIDRAPMAGLSDRYSPVPLFTGVSSDFMSKLINLTDKPQRSRHFERLSTRDDFLYAARKKEIQTTGGEMETRIMHGKIEIQQSETRYPDFRYKFEKSGEDQDLPLMSVSSMVSELAPVSLFLRHHVLPGDLFILEEPEAHLHPAAQRAISNILVRLANCGVHAIVTTHSDYILEQIGNYACAAAVGEAIDGQTLEEEKISVYLFDQSEEGDVGETVVKPVPLDKETGFVTQDHLDVSSALYNETVGLMEKRDTDAN